MVPPGHIAASYLLSQSPRLVHHKPLDQFEVLTVVAAGFLIDLDIPLAVLFGLSQSQHHLLPTHTPIFLIPFGLLLTYLLRHKLSPLSRYLTIASLLLHLILDDLAYWLYLLGLQQLSSYPQIFWLYPFDPRFGIYKGHHIAMSVTDFLQIYATQAPVSLILESLLVITALWLFSQLSLSKK